MSKIKCDDCKFEQDCVDYGWEGCKKYTPKPKVEQTNEEWFDSLTTEDKAKVLRRRTYGNSEDNESVEQSWINWLKAKHEDNPPDIPSVPSWDKWLQGERTKCTYCDGNGVECDLYGRSECPKTPKTEQEYIQTCTTEQLAESLLDVWYGIDDVINIMSEDGEIGKKDAMIQWLKQPHSEVAE